MGENRGPDIPYLAAKIARDNFGFEAALDSVWHYVGQPEQGVGKVSLICRSCSQDFEAFPYKMAGVRQLYVTLFIGRCPTCKEFYWLCDDPEFAARVLKERA